MMEPVAEGPRALDACGESDRGVGVVVAWGACATTNAPRKRAWRLLMKCRVITEWG